jgi:3',5'-cyclic AMP phosphodiesterase CpdA
MLLCQISDPHVVAAGQLAYGKVDTVGMLERCIAQVLALNPAPDAVVITGDLTNDGAPAQYATLAQLLAPLPMPVYLACGNHDHRGTLQASFAQASYLRGEGGFVQYTVEDLPVRLVVLDTTEPGREGGHLCSARLDWLDRTLAQSSRPTVIAQHHPPFATGMQLMDTMSLDNPQDEEAVVARHPQVQRILCGHYHRNAQALFGGALACLCPSTAQQLVLDLAIGAEIRIAYEPPAFQLHALVDGRMVTHTVPIGAFPTWGTRD